MAKIVRKPQKVFGEDSAPDQISVFGSFAAAAPDFTTDPTEIQSLSQFLEGWPSAVLADNSPCMEDMNALFYLAFYQIAYMFQQGIAEYNAATTYYEGSIVNINGLTYVSIQDDNLNHAVTGIAWWCQAGNRTKNVTTTYTVDPAKDQYLRGVTVGGAFTITLPPVASCALGQKFTLKNVGNNSFDLTIEGDGAETIDAQTNIVLSNYDSITVSRSEFGWDIV